MMIMLAMGYLLALCEIKWGQLGESGEYRMGRSESGLFSHSEL
jgi:hypothetical protein